MKPLPDFKTRKQEDVSAYATQVLTHSDVPETSYFQRLETFDDGHYRVIFSLVYFRETDTPTKSQWNSLKKKMRRHDKLAFIFKEHGLIAGENTGYIDFGFFLHMR